MVHKGAAQVTVLGWAVACQGKGQVCSVPAARRAACVNTDDSASVACQVNL